MTEPWPPAPVEISGSVVLRLLGLKLATIKLDLVVYATHRLARWAQVVDRAGAASPIDGSAPAERTTSFAAPRRGSGSPRRSPELPRNGGGPAAQGELREVLQLLEKTSKMLE